jgi:AAA domain-containing protein
MPTQTKARSKAKAKPPPAGGGNTSGQQQQQPNFSDILDDASKSGQAFCDVQFPPRELIFDDWFKEGDLGYVFAPRGQGKTWLGIVLAIAIATGSKAGPTDRPILVSLSRPNRTWAYRRTGRGFVEIH